MGLFFFLHSHELLVFEYVFFKMPKIQELSEFEQGEIIGLWKGGYVE